jgi:hypothetical protein
MPGSSTDILTATGAELAAKMASQRAIGSAWSLVQFRLTSSAQPPYWLLCPSIGGALSSLSSGEAGAGDAWRPILSGRLFHARSQAATTAFVLDLLAQSLRVFAAFTFAPSLVRA